MAIARHLSPIHSRWVRILGVAFVMHIVSYMDRTNIAMAVPAMRAELNMSAASVGFASGWLFFAYMIFQIPSGRLAATWSVRRIIFFMSIAWGVASLSTAFVHTELELVLNRFAVGLCEGGEMTAVIVLIRHWFTRAERARANTLFMMSVPLSSVIANPVSGLLLEHFGWQAMFVLEALPAVVWALVWWVAICDRPEQATWLDPAERAGLIAQLAEEDRAQAPYAGHWSRVIWDPFVLLFALYNLLALTGSWGLSLWLPTMLKETGASIQLVGLVSALPYAAAALSMLWVAFSSDRRQERKWHMIGCTMLAGVFLLAAPFVEGRLLGIVGCFILVQAAFYGRFGPFWALPSEVFPASVVGVAIGIVNGIGNLGGFVGPYVFGAIKTRTDSFSLALVVGAVAFLLAGVVAMPLRVRRTRAAAERLALRPAKA